MIEIKILQGYVRYIIYKLQVTLNALPSMYRTYLKLYFISVYADLNIDFLIFVFSDAHSFF